MNDTTLPVGATPTLGSNNPSGNAVAGVYTGPQSYAGMGTSNANGASINVPNVMPASSITTSSVATPPVPQSQTDNLQGLVSQATVGLNQANQAVTGAENTYNQGLNSSNELQRLLLGQTADTAAMNTQYGIPQMNQDIRNLQLQQQGQQAKYLQGLTQIESGNIRSLSNNQITALNRQNALDTAITGAQISAKQGNLLYAQEIISNAITAKYQPIKDALTLQNQILAQNKDSLDRADRKAADAKIFANTLQMKQIEYNQQQEKDLQSVILNAQTQQAPQDLVARASKAKSATEAALILGPYAGDYWGTKVKISEYNKNLAAAAKDKAGITPTTGNLAVSPVEQAQFGLDTINNALKLANASGASGISKFVGNMVVGDTDYNRLSAQIRTLKTNLLTMATDPNIKKFFGPQMSNNDVKMMQAAATTLDEENMSPQDLKTELNRVQGIFQKLAPGYSAKQKDPQTWAQSVQKALVSPTSGGNYGYSDNKQP